MPTNRYHRTLSLITMTLIFAVIALSILLYNNGPRVRIVDFDKNPAEASFIKGTTVSIEFDRPLQQNDYTEQIKFAPQIEFSAQTTTQAIILTLQENFQHDTEYTLQVGSDIFDQTGKPMGGQYQQTISAQSPAYVFLERNYSGDSQNSTNANDAEDHIKLAILGNEAEVVFSNPNISMFAANSDYVIVATSEADKDQLYTVDLKSREVRQEQFLLEGRINNLAISPRGKVALFTVTPDFDVASREYYEQFANSLESINLETGETRSLTDNNEQPQKANFIDFNNDGQAALIQGLDQSFYAISPFDDYDPVLIGSYSATQGFNDSSSEIVFRNRTDFLRYDVVTGSTLPIELDLGGFIQSIVDLNGKIYVSVLTNTTAGSGNFVYVLDDWEDNDPEIIWSNDNPQFRFLRGLEVSYDGNLLALQLDPDNCQFDRFRNNSQCQQTRTIIYDLTDRDAMTDFAGFDLVWLP